LRTQNSGQQSLMPIITWRRHLSFRRLRPRLEKRGSWKRMLSSITHSSLVFKPIQSISPLSLQTLLSSPAPTSTASSIALQQLSSCTSLMRYQPLALKLRLPTSLPEWNKHGVEEISITSIDNRWYAVHFPKSRRGIREGTLENLA